MPPKDYRLELKSSARKELLALPAQAISRIQRDLNRTLYFYRQGQPAPDIRPIEGRANTYRLKIGTYRALFEVDEEAAILRVFRIGHRKDVYRNL